MADLLSLRDYQREAIDKINACWDRGVKRPVAVLPTGAGKTVVFSHLTREFTQGRPDRRTLVLAHTDELVTQAARKIKQVAPHLPVGIVKGARNEVWAPVIVASVQSLRQPKRLAQLCDVGLIIVDECHHATSKTYRAILEHFGAFDPASDVRIVGFTATLSRGDGVALNTVWDEVAISRDILFMINRGYLLDVRGVSVEVPDLDLDQVKRSRGDFQDADLGRVVTDSLAPELVAKAYVEHAKERSGLAFWPTVDAAYVGAEAMSAQGIVTEVIHGSLKMADRRAILERFTKGRTQVISNVMVLTEGFDAPCADVVVLGRPTRSKPLYQQIVGRVLRPYPGQAQALILDICGTSRTNDLRSLVDLSDKPIRAIREGQSLVEAAQESEESLGNIVVPYHGPVVFAEFDPLARKSKRVWLTTTAGTRLVAWGEERYLFLVPTTLPDAAPGTWDVAWCTKSTAWTMPDGSQSHGGFTEHRGMGLEYAMRWAEDMAGEVADSESDYGCKSSSWRRQAASSKQIAYARQLGCEVADDVTGGDVSTAIEAALATRRVDPIVTRILEGVGK
jgi:superfamily II DNA or RNA helicase